MSIQTYTITETANWLRVSEGSVWKWWETWGLKRLPACGKLLFSQENIIDVIWQHRKGLLLGDGATSMDMPSTMPMLLLQTEAAHYLRYSVRSLQLLRDEWGLMVVYLLPRRPLYVESDIEQFLAGGKCLN